LNRIYVIIKLVFIYILIILPFKCLENISIPTLNLLHKDEPLLYSSSFFILISTSFQIIYFLYFSYHLYPTFHLYILSHLTSLNLIIRIKNILEVLSMFLILLSSLFYSSIYYIHVKDSMAFLNSFLLYNNYSPIIIHLILIYQIYHHYDH
jgi:hypothetical protein